MPRLPTSVPSCGKGRASAQLAHIEADLARIVGPRGAQALLLRSRQLCGAQAESPARLASLLHLVRQLLGQGLVRWLVQPR